MSRFYKIIFFIACLFLSEVSIADLNTGLKAYWNFNGNLNDLSGNGNNGMLVGGSQYKMGLVNKSLYLDGAGDYVSLGSNFNLTTNYSVSVLIKSEDIARRYPGIFAKYQTNGYGPFDFDLHYDKVNMWISDGVGGYKEVDSRTSIKVNTWYHIVYTVAGTQAKIYINGSLDTQGIVPLMTRNSDNVTIGRQAYLFSPYNLEFKGYIDELRIYDRVLSATEIQALFFQAFPQVVKGTVSWAKLPYTFQCVNNSTFQKITRTTSTPDFDCEKAGLKAKSGDDITVSIRAKKK